MRRRRRSGQSGHGTGDLWCRIPDHGARYPGRSFNLERRRSHGPDPELGRSRAATSEKLSRQKFAATELLRSEEHTSELKSLMRISYADFCLKTTTPRPKTKQH